MAFSGAIIHVLSRPSFAMEGLLNLLIRFSCVKRITTQNGPRTQASLFCFPLGVQHGGQPARRYQETPGRRQYFNSASSRRICGAVPQAIGDKDRSILHDFCFICAALHRDGSPVHTSCQDWNGTARAGGVLQETNRKIFAGLARIWSLKSRMVPLLHLFFF